MDEQKKYQDTVRHAAKAGYSIEFKKEHMEVKLKESDILFNATKNYRQADKIKSILANEVKLAFDRGKLEGLKEAQALFKPDTFTDEKKQNIDKGVDIEYYDAPLGQTI
jgi:hypothetical protein